LKTEPNKTSAWKALEAHAQESALPALKDLANNAERAKAYQIALPDFIYHYGRHRITDTTLDLLEQLFDQCYLQPPRQ
jgi:glucose-6-phosphate isomerase